MTKENTARVGRPVELDVRVKNTGESKWLHRNIREIGVVRVGVHLLDRDKQMLKHDFARGELKADLLPGEAVTVKFSVVFIEPGEYILSIDMVAEYLYWFEMLGSHTQYLHFSVE
ncbi:MAG: hypothetical protein JSV25_14920 [Spirochaetota bacterium]|nr:MAG: hypothetical protein JSV25_14920 [Spirochaetota bacterium]